MNPVAHIQRCDGYLAERQGCYEYRRERYIVALRVLQSAGLNDDHTVIDVGAGWTEFDVCLRIDGNSRARYYPVDGCLDGVDLEAWEPLRSSEFFVALELLEHLSDPERLVRAMQRRCTRALVVSTPNPATTDVLGMDRTHKTPIEAAMLRSWGFELSEQTLYGGVWSDGKPDSLVGVWRP